MQMGLKVEIPIIACILAVTAMSPCSYAQPVEENAGSNKANGGRVRFKLCPPDESSNGKCRICAIATSKDVTITPDDHPNQGTITFWIDGKKCSCKYKAICQKPSCTISVDCGADANLFDLRLGDWDKDPPQNWPADLMPKE
jgi:hypothetical protein